MRCAGPAQRPDAGMASRGDFEVVRDPLWNNIRVDAEALEVVDSEPFQRLRLDDPFVGLHAFCSGTRWSLAYDVAQRRD